MRFTWFISVYKISIFLYTIAINIELLYFKEYGNNYSFFFCSDTCLMFLFISENCSVVRSTILSLSAVYCMHVCVCVSECVLCTCVRFDVSTSASGRRGSHFLRVLRVPFSNTLPLLPVDLVCLFSSDLNKRIFFRLSFPFPVQLSNGSRRHLGCFCFVCVLVEWTTNSSLKVG